MNMFTDGIKNIVSSLINRRSVINQNRIESPALDQVTLRQAYKHGIINKIIRLKVGHALKDTIQFESTDDGLYYNARLAKAVKQTAMFMLGFGRGVIVLFHDNDDLTRPLGTVDPLRVKFRVFSGDMISTGGVDMDIMSDRYYKPLTYNIRGVAFHWTRVVDFTYIKPPELEAPKYFYGGISETEMIYEQVIADGVVQRASPKIIEKASTLFYKMKGFRDAMRQGTEADIVNYVSRMEDVRGVLSAGLIDFDDEIEAVQQTIANLADADQITLRRLAMVSGIPLALLVGENVKGLNSTGDNERAAFQDMIEALQSDYIIDPVNELMRKCGQGVIAFKENQGETATTRIEFETKAIDNAIKLASIGEDYSLYLNEKDVVQVDDMAGMFPDET